MRFSVIAALAATIPSTLAGIKGFNYDANDLSGAPKSVGTWESEFNAAKTLSGVLVPFTSARIYTSVQPGTSNSPSNAFEAAVNTGTSLLVGIWASAGQTQIDNEVAAIQAAIAAHGDALTSLIAGISVGSEDVYRITPLGVASNAGAGADPATIAGYISQVKARLNLGKPVGHVDTYNTYSNSSGWMSNVISVSDFIGMDAYPYYETTKPNSIENANATFWADYEAVAAVAAGKPIYITESGWPTTGPTSGEAVPSVANAETYYQDVACHAFANNINTWWYTLEDTVGGTAPSFGVISNGVEKYVLHCS